MATTSYGTPYVQSSDLVSGWPNASLNVANRIDEVSYAGNGINAQTGTSYTLAVADAGKLVTLNNAAAVAVSLPQDSTANLPVGSVTRIYNLGAGVVTVQAGSGATLQGGSVTVAQYDACEVTKLSANTYGIAAKASAMTLVTSVAMSGSSVSLNSVFTSTYDTYLVRLFVIGSSLAKVYGRLRASGSDLTTSTYDYYGVYSGASGPTGENTGSQSAFVLIGDLGSDTLAQDIIIRNPAASTATSGYWITGDTRKYATHYGFTNTTAAAYDGFTVYSTAGSFASGSTIRVYGYKNS